MKPFLNSDEQPANEYEWLEALLELARYLRSPEGCPWDRQQTTASFARYMREEADELNEAVAEGDNAHIAEELGDTFFVALMTAAVAEDEGRFPVKEFLENAYRKMIRRHAHIFGGRKAESVDDIIGVWNQVKAEEKQKRLES
jgi:tetrapyrrole methylase family protein/MazG family protein